ncbi:ATP-grasp domain-containing protein [Amycolatopsis arida]|uniref:ATP-grasp domain-containing protein n=1 Tax=Amycolatopsis arida TaxID=587909 RepID=A0A1I5XFV2_9PSEU|nr:ATP-grasp domain-containing protein [Amycolatopsis arida]TDX97480.1 ATP-grasp domain-containing protein [Amycolatopsis arida]SFQ30838.1 ATP-grasp domain-containing protein [Amycolatopsis arida]
MSQIDVFVVGLDEPNLRTLHDVPDAIQYRFHGLLDIDEVQHGEIDVADLIRKAERRLDEFDGEIGAIVGYWDFPVSTIVPILCRRYGLPSADLEAVIRCEHKYWSRLEQSKVIDEHPKFAVVDPERPEKPAELSYPMWLKPVKSFSSELAFHVGDDAELADAVRQIADGIDRVGNAFDYLVRQLDLPPEIAEVGGKAILAEEAMSGQQAASEGYVHDGEVVVYGVLDSLNYPGTSSFLRHQYPSQLPEPMVERIREVSRRVIERIGLNNCTFSIEFFCQPESGDIGLLEVNPRHSQSHAELFEYVDGVPNHYFMLSLGLGRDPNVPHRKGPYELAAKWYHRRFGDALVTRVPTDDEIKDIQEDVPGVVIDVKAPEGERLSSMTGQDSYSYELSHIYIGADDEDELKRKYERVVDSLRFEFVDAEEAR